MPDEKVSIRKKMTQAFEQLIVNLDALELEKQATDLLTVINTAVPEDYEAADSTLANLTMLSSIVRETQDKIAALDKVLNGVTLLNVAWHKSTLATLAREILQQLGNLVRRIQTRSATRYEKEGQML